MSLVYIKNVFILETDGLSDQNNVKREMNQGQKIFFFGDFVLNVEALSFHFYRTIKRENKHQDPRVPQLLDVETNFVKTLIIVSIMCLHFLKIIFLINCSPFER